MVGVVGAAVVIIGVIASFPLVPGPGVLILFAGLVILGTEFLWAQRVLQWVRDRYESWLEWTRQQSPLVRLGVLALTGVVVLVALWLVGAFGMVADWVGLQWDWLRSPLA